MQGAQIFHSTQEGKMAQFVVDFKTGDDLREAWNSQLSAGMCFIATPNVFPLGSKFNLVLRVPQLQRVLVVPAQVVRLETNAAPPRAKGMVTQFLAFQSYESKLQHLIFDVEGGDVPPISDFSTALQQEDSVENRNYQIKADSFLKGLKEKNIYDLLHITASAGQAEAQRALNILTKDLLLGKDLKTTDPTLNKLKFEVDQALRKISKTLVDPVQRAKYDAENGIAVQNKDESQADFQRKTRMALIIKVKANNKETVEKADRMFKDAEVALREGDVTSALKNIRIASMYDPLNPLYKDRMNDLEKRFSRESRKTGDHKITASQTKQFVAEVQALIQERTAAWSEG